MKRIASIILSCLVIASCAKPVLPAGHWNKEVYQTLTELIETEGSASAAYDPECRPYAVFDFDNTTVINDIEHTSMTYVIENLLFITPPDMFAKVLTDCLPDVDQPLNLKMDRVITSRTLADDLAADYSYLYDNYIAKFTDHSSPEAAAALKQVQESDQFKDFRAKFWTFYKGIGSTFDYVIGCQWLQVIYDGRTPEQVQGIVKEALTYYSEVRPLRNEVWESPDMGEAGKVSCDVEIGFAITDEMHQLYNSLMDNGIDVYVVSASMEPIVEEAACDETFGFALDTAYVYGMRMLDDGSGLVHAVLDTTYQQTCKEGKTKAIMAYIAPSHGGRGPVLVAGDSNGDFSMLTSFPDLKVGLIIDCGNTGSIGDLTEYARLQATDGPVSARAYADSVHLTVSPEARYVVQGRNFSRGELVK